MLYLTRVLYRRSMLLFYTTVSYRMYTMYTFKQNLTLEVNGLLYLKEFYTRSTQCITLNQNFILEVHSEYSESGYI